MALGLAVPVRAELYGYEKFPTNFTYALGALASTNHVVQYVDVRANAAKAAYARCSQYNYTGNMPVLTVKSESSKYPTLSVSFTAVDNIGKAMQYTTSIPTSGKVVKFTGTVTQYSTSFSLIASVKG